MIRRNRSFTNLCRCLRLSLVTIVYVDALGNSSPTRGAMRRQRTPGLGTRSVCHYNQKY